MLRGKKVLGNVGVGVTCPFFCEANDGNIYIVKTNKKNIPAQILISEFLGKFIGERLELIFPHSDLIDISQLKMNESFFSLQFASQYIPYIEYLNHDHLKKAINIKEMAGVILFDHIFHNPDRIINRKNLLFSHLGHRIYAIDNSHLFKCSHWNNEVLKKLTKQVSVYQNHLYGVLLRNFLTKEDFYPYINRIKTISKNEILSIISQIPDEWEKGNFDLNYLIDFIITRFDNIEKIAEAILPKTKEEQLI
ncbi:HipA family kinase [Anaerosinus sp.]